MENKLIIVEGLTGSGKSTLAHFLARQLTCQGLCADWLHEGEIDHPLSVEPGDDMERYMSLTRQRWAIFADHIQMSDRTMVIEACFLNNLVETLMSENISKGHIIQFVQSIQHIIAPLNPALLYLTQSNTAYAMKRNFQNRGVKFEKFVIDFATGTPYAQARGYQGYEGMIRFWEDFVELTDPVYTQFPFQKILLDITSGDWQSAYQEALAFLNIPFTREGSIPAEEARSIAGVYTDPAGRHFEVTCQQDNLYINLFHTVKTRLIPMNEKHFLAEGWHFEITFTERAPGETGLNIHGRDIDYLKLAGTTAVKNVPSTKMA